MKNSHMNQDNQVVDDFIGFVVHGEAEAFNLYNNYAIRTGFSVRKSKKRYDINKNIRQREYRCSKAGYRLDDKYFSPKQCRTLETRNGCEAMIRFSVDDGKWTVSKFVSNHNHELALPSEIHMLRSNKNVIPLRTIRSKVDAGTSTDSFLYMSKEARRDEYLGLTKKNRCDYVNQTNNLSIEAGDSQSLLDYFKERIVKGGFFYTVQVDQENRINNYFWRDGRSRMDYDSFGDVLVLDTTYRLDKYNLLCASFMGVNHHRQNVMFGCALLLNATTTSYIWLFESFLESMGGKAPQTIFTNEDQEIENAIALVFPRSCHRLCIWHILQNASLYLGSLDSNSEFRHLFYKMLQKCESEEEFDKIWNQMRDSFEAIRTHNWWNKLYNLRRKWCKGLNKEVFSAAILSSERSEAMSGVLNKIANKTTSLAKFAHQIEGIVAGWRSFESREDFRCKQGMTSQVLKTSGLLNHAAATYTCEIFKQFEKQFWNVLATISIEVAVIGNVHTYEIKGEVDSRVRIVHFNTSTMTISCSCKKFESKGFVCCHILRVLSINNVTKIPKSCIFHRWTKDANKRQRELEQQGEIASLATYETGSIFGNEMMRSFYDIITKCQDDEICRQLCRDALRNLSIDIENHLSALNAKEPHHNEDNVAKEKSKAKKDLSKCVTVENVKRRKEDINSKLNDDGTSASEVDPKTNFPVSNFQPQLMSTSMQVQVSPSLPLTDQISNENNSTSPASFACMMQNINSQIDLSQVDKPS
ncbi:protein FAR1-RELATED SEQUENCE 5-like [Euphorbia lathyris]|uniref:protein FAR1-RELATED SEQUENCE 5-like n=1 Tax=Euphorbia lathyris TaxID=212925 RepID=UPI0033135B73